MPSSLEQLDLLLLTVRKTRRVQQEGIRFEGYRYIDTTLAGYVREDVLIRYDPADLAEIRVYYQDTFLCRAICQELSGQTVRLKEIEKARSERRRISTIMWVLFASFTFLLKRSQSQSQDFLYGRDAFAFAHMIVQLPPMK